MPVVEVSDGTEVEFPDSMSDADIQSALQQHYFKPDISSQSATPQPPSQIPSSLQAAYEDASAGFEPGAAEGKARSDVGIPFGESFLPPIPQPKRETLVGQALQAPVNVASEFIQGAASPVGVAAMGLGPAPRIVQAGAGLGFGLPAMKQGLERVYKGAALADPQQVMEGALQTLTGGFISGGGVSRILPKASIAATETLLEKGIKDASEISKATEVHGDVQPQPVESPGQVPHEEGGGGVQPQTQETRQAERDVLLNPTGPGTIGKEEMGAAGIEEKSTLPTGTGLKNAVGEMERVGLGLQDAPETVQRNMAKAWSDAGDVATSNPEAGTKLADSLIADPERGLTDSDSALLLRYKVDLFNKMNDAAERSHVGDETARKLASAEHDQLVTRYGALLDAVKLRGAEWGREGRWRQAMAKEDYDFSSTDGLNRYHRSLTGEDLPGKKAGKAEEIATGVKQADVEADKATSALQDELKRKAPTPSRDIAKAEQDAFDAAKKAVRENAIRVADLENKQRVASTVEAKETADIQKRAAQKALDAATKVAREAAIRLAKAERQVKDEAVLNDQAKAARKALDAADKVVRENAKALADAETKRRVAKEANDRKVAAVQAKAAQKALDSANKRHREAASAVAKAERALRADPVKAVWSKVRDQIDRGETDFDQIRKRVAMELGMKMDAVARIMARDATVKRLMDDAWLKQQRARDLKVQAKRFVIGADTPEWVKVAQSVPRVMFGLKTLGHAAVPLGTHAPFVAFRPNYWGTYFKRYGTMWKMVANKAFYEQQVRDLQENPNYITARRGGLVNDPRSYEDYTSPDVVKYITGGGAGVRSFTVLKILRQDIFDREWNKLDRSLQTDEMAKAISDAVNHDTGVIKAMAPKAIGTALFAPRLEASRVMSLLLDPAKAAGILTKQMWTRVTPAERHFAIKQIQSKAVIAATLYGLLKANQAILSAVGSKQQVNTSDPMRSDFLKFKVAGMDFAYGNALISMMRMPLSLYRVVSSDGGKARNLVYEDESVYTVLGRYSRSQFSPFMGTLTDLGLGADFASRPLPRSGFGLLEQKRPTPKRLQAEGMGPYKWSEYWSEQLSPIPGQEAVKEVWRHGIGMSDEQIKALEKAVAISSVMGATGGRLTPDYPPRKTVSSYYK